MRNPTDVGPSRELTRRLVGVFAVIFIVLHLAGCSHGRAIKRGAELFEQGKYDQALLAYEEALEAKPESDEAAAGISATRRQLVLQLIESGETALSEGEFVQSLEYWERASAVPGRYAELIGFGDVLRESTTTFAESAERHGDYAIALFVYERFSESDLVERSEFEERMTRISRVWAEESVRLGMEKIERGYDFYGFLLFAHASHLSHESDYQDRLAQLRQRMGSTLTYSVRVNREGARGLEPWPGPSFSTEDHRLIRVLTDIQSTDVDASVHVRPLSAVITHRESRSNESVEYQSGTRVVSNPYYEDLETRVYHAERRLTDVEREVTKRQLEVSKRQLELEKLRTRESDESSSRVRGALRELENAHRDLERSYREVNDARGKVQRVRDKMNRTSRTVDEPVYSIYTYPVITHTTDGAIDVEFTIQHSDGRDDLRVSKTLQLELSDYEHDAHPMIGLGRKFIDMPSDRQIEDQLMRAAAEHIMQGIHNSLDGFRSAIFNHASESPDSDIKVNGLVRYLWLSGGKINSDLDDSIFEITGIPAAHRVLLNLRN